MELKGDTYKERCEDQLQKWIEGNPVHNNIDEECCPDFSCCNKDLLQPKEIRETYKHAKQEQREEFLCLFLGNAISSINPESNVEIIDSNQTHIKKNLN